MKKKLPLSIILLSFFMPLAIFCQSPCIDLRGDFSTLYADGDESSFLYASSLSASFFNDSSQVNFSAGYVGLTSDINYVSATANSGFFSTELIVDDFKTGFFFFGGGIPQELSVNFSDKRFIQQSIGLEVAGLSFDYDISPSLGFGLTGIVGSENTGAGSLYYLNGTVTFPFFTSLRLRTKLPGRFDLYTGFSFIELNVFTGANKFGSGSVWEWDVFFNKTFSWNYGHSLNLFLGGMGIYGHGDALLLSTMIDYPFFPFTYLRFDGGFNFFLLGCGLDYNYTRGRFNFDSRFALAFDVYSRMNGFYKYIYQNTIVYDGSSGIENLSRETVVNDFLFYFSFKASYDFNLNKKAGFENLSIYVGKTILIPALNIRETSSSGNNTSPQSDSDINNDNINNSEINDSDISKLVKMILLSGIQVGFSLRFN